MAIYPSIPVPVRVAAALVAVAVTSLTFGTQLGFPAPEAGIQTVLAANVAETTCARANGAATAAQPALAKHS